MLKVFSLPLTLLLFAALLGGCAARLSPAPANLARLPAEPSLWKLALRSGGEARYTGLLLLSQGEAGTGMVLLDPTGIKLLEGQVKETGEVVAVKALRPVADRGLPNFLGGVVQRLFLMAPPPAGETCRPAGFGQLCQGLNESGQLSRIRSWGPFVLWTADYSINNEVAPPLLTGARLGEGWLAPEVGLARQLEPPE